MTKRDEVLRALNDPALATLSTRELAERLGCSHVLVSRVCKELGVNSEAETQACSAVTTQKTHATPGDAPVNTPRVMPAQRTFQPVHPDNHRVAQALADPALERLGNHALAIRLRTSPGIVGRVRQQMYGRLHPGPVYRGMTMSATLMDNRRPHGHSAVTP